MAGHWWSLAPGCFASIPAEPRAKGLASPVVGWDLTGWANEVGAAAATIVPSLDRSQNLLIRAEGPWGRWFVKVYANPAYSIREWAAMEIAPATGVPRLTAGGTWDGRDWSAFEWVDLVPFDLGEDGGPKSFADAVADVHAGALPAGHKLAQHDTAGEMLQFRLGLLAETSPTDAARLGALHDVSARAVELADEIRSRSTDVLLHGDVLSRNLARRRNGSAGAAGPFLYDFERSSVGGREYDLFRAWHTDLAEPSVRRRFLARYRQRSGFDDDRWPDERLLWLLSLLHAAGAIPFAREADLPGFEALARRVLTWCEEQAPGLDWAAPVYP